MCDSTSITKQHWLRPNTASLVKQNGRAQASVVSSQRLTLQDVQFDLSWHIAEMRVLCTVNSGILQKMRVLCTVNFKYKQGDHLP